MLNVYANRNTATILAPRVYKR